MATAIAADGPDAQQGRDDRHHAIADGGGQCSIGAHAGGLEDDRGVVHERVDPGELSREAQTDADQQQLDDPALTQQLFDGRTFARVLALRFHLVHFAPGLFRRVTQGFQHVPGVVVTAFGSQPVRRRRHEKRADQQQHARHHRHRQHVTPDTRRVQQGGEHGTEHVRQQLAADDHQLIAADQPTASFRPGNFGDEHRHRG